MATTDAKPGFRLPWSSDRSEAASPAESVADALAADASPQVQENETTEMIDAAPAAPDHEAVVEHEAAAGPEPAATVAPPAATPAAAPSRKPNKFMADLTRAMQAAAETAREESLARFSADAKAHVEGIHAASAEEATELRKRADDDVAAIRDWSKAEIARIREETDERIAHRKTNLEQEIEEHAAYIERRIERVQARVDAFEAEMAAFFERLLAEDDPTRFAAMAESLPEPPSFDVDVPASAVATAAPIVAAPEPEPVVEAAPEPEPEPEPVVESVAETPEAEAEVSADMPTPDAEATAPLAVEPTPEAPQDSGDLFGITADAAIHTTGDPRLNALGLGGADFAAAEAEAASFTPDDAGDGSEESGAEVAEIADETIAARLAGLVPEGEAGAAESTTTRVVVTGLISVASIAGFKRHLSRAPGVQSVGVSSGPDGEFVFAVVHGADIALRDVIPTLPGFGARVTSESDGEVVASAHDPEAEG